MAHHTSMHSHTPTTVLLCWFRYDTYIAYSHWVSVFHSRAKKLRLKRDMIHSTENRDEYKPHLAIKRLSNTNFGRAFFLSLSAFYYIFFNMSIIRFFCVLLLSKQQKNKRRCLSMSNKSHTYTHNTQTEKKKEMTHIFWILITCMRMEMEFNSSIIRNKNRTEWNGLNLSKCIWKHCNNSDNVKTAIQRQCDFSFGRNVILARRQCLIYCCCQP